MVNVFNFGVVSAKIDNEGFRICGFSSGGFGAESGSFGWLWLLAGLVCWIWLTVIDSLIALARFLVFRV